MKSFTNFSTVNLNLIRISLKILKEKIKSFTIDTPDEIIDQITQIQLDNASNGIYHPLFLIQELIKAIDDELKSR